jgi:uncharacterized protein involved in exopolysaccharide biosynthesis
MSNLMQNVSELKTLIAQVEFEVQSLSAGKKASAPRIRATLQKIKALAHSMRAGVTQFTSALPTKTRVKVAPTPTNTPEPEEVEVIPAPPTLERQNTVMPVKKARKKAVKLI